MVERIGTAPTKAPEKLKLTDLLHKAQIELDAREFEQAKALVDSGLKQWPSAMRLHLMNAELLEAQGKVDQAIAALNKAAEAFPANLQPVSALAHVCLRHGKIKEARSALSAARSRGLDDESDARLHLLIAKASGDWPSAELAAEKIVEKEAPRLAQVLLTLAQARLQTKNAAGAEEAAARALANDPKLVTAAHVAAHAAAEMGDAEKMLSHYRTLTRLAPNDTRWPLKLVATLSVSGRYFEAVQEFEAVLQRWPSDPLVKRFLQRSPLGGFLLEEAIRRASDQPEEHDTADEDEEDDALGRSKRDAARSVAIANVETTARSEMAIMRKLYERAPAESQLLRPIVVDDLRREVLVGKRNGADTVVFVFTGVNDRMWMPLELFDRYLAALGVTAVYLKDFQRLLHLKGVQSLANSFAGTVVKLRELTTELGAKRICTMGHSGGGRPAIRYGVELEADRIINFGGATGRAPCLMGTDRQFNGIIWRRALANIPEEMLDLKPFLASRRHNSKITLVFGDGMDSERADAEYLEGLPGVRLYPIAGASHEVLRSLAERDELYRTLAELLES